jgi:hypothetical protein
VSHGARFSLCIRARAFPPVMMIPHFRRECAHYASASMAWSPSLLRRTHALSQNSF